MALRNQPYIPLYVQDYLTDEKLNMCSLKTQGVYIKVMCALHKQKEYGSILLKQKDKQTESIYLNFALKFAKLLPIDHNDLHDALVELVDEDVLTIDGDTILQRRMVKDNGISEKRANAGAEGGKRTQYLAKANVKAKKQAKPQANTENESEDENEDKSNIKEGVEKLKISDLLRFEPGPLDLTQSVVDQDLDEEQKQTRLIMIQSELIKPGMNLDNLMRAINCSEDDTIKWIIEYIKHIGSTREYCQPLSAIYKHYTNWIKIKLKKQENDKEKNGDRYSNRIRTMGQSGIDKERQHKPIY